jgi:uncharacterized protein (DUF1330 family)
MTVYVVALLDITDREEYGLYGQGFMEIFGKYGGQLLAVDESPTVVEGDWPHTRTVLLSFPGAGEMDRWYRSPEYQALAKHRFKASTARIAMIQGLG